MATTEDFDGIFLEGDKEPVLLLHGLSSSPTELLLLGKELNDIGHAIYIPRLSGHATSLRDFRTTRTKQWSLDAHRALEFASNHGKSQCVVVGHSFGATLALLLAAYRPSLVRKIALLSPTLAIKPTYATWVVKLLGLLPERVLDFLPMIPKRHNDTYCLVVPRSAYPVHGLGPVVRMFKIVRHVLRRISRVTQPVLICFDPLDHLAHVASLRILENKLSRLIVGCHAYPGGNHELLNGKHRDKIILKIKNFVDDSNTEPTNDTQTSSISSVASIN